MKPELAYRQSPRLSACARCYYSSPDVQQRNLTTELLQTLAGHQQTAGGFLNLERQYGPQYDQLALDRQRQNMFGFVDPQSNYHPGTLDLGRAGAHFQRAGDINDVATLGPAAFDAFLRSNPLLARSLTNLSGRTADSPLLTLLNSQATEGLAGDGALSPQEARALDQQTRGAFSDRGTVMGNQAIGSELLNRDAAVRQRRQQAQALAGQVQGMNQQQNDFVGRASQIFSTTLNDPFQSILNRSSGSAASGAGGNYPQIIGSGSRLFDPLNPYVSDLYSSNNNAVNAGNIANANANNATTSAVISGVGSILGGLLSDERIKKDLKRTGKKTPEGIPKSRWRYKTDKKGLLYEGVTAQDAERVRPDVVLTDPISGIKAVNYSALMDPLELVNA
jgi:hypothetical protein